MNIEKIIVGAIATNCYIIPLESGGALLLDPGDGAKEIIKKLEAFHLDPRFIVFTHGHFDHLAALPKIISHYAQAGFHPEIMIHKNDAYFLGKEAYKHHCESLRAISGGDNSFIDGLWEEMPEPTTLLEEGDLVEQFKVLCLPGHSSGSIALYDEKNALLLSGDTLFKRGVGRTDLPGGEPEKLEESLHRLFALPGNTAVYPGHGPSTTIAAEVPYYP